jgi:galactose mutarotase-like enzyme
MDKIKISNEYVRAVFDSDWGGHFLALQFNHSDLGWVDIFMTEIEPTKSSQNTPFFSCLTMVPFANRIRDGVVVGADDRFQFPINLYSQNLPCWFWYWAAYAPLAPKGCPIYGG